MLRLIILLSLLPAFASAQRLPPTHHGNRVSAASPFPASCNGQQAGVISANAEVEPMVTADPGDPNHLIGAWQQDRWSNGASAGLITAVSTDGGRNWTRNFAHFSRCSGGNDQNGANYLRASDPWVSISPGGVAYQVSLSLDVSQPNSAILVSRSADGGFTWGEPVTIRHDNAAGVLNDKESLTADPFDARYVYVVWDRVAGTDSSNPANYRGPTWFARTTDAGATWEAARSIYDPGPNSQTIGNQIVVLPDGTVVDFFLQILNASAALASDSPTSLAIIRSTDHGATWSAPIIVAAEHAIGVSDVKNGVPVRAGNLVASIAADRKTGALYAVWQDGGFSSGQRSGIALSRSFDGGFTWTAPVQVNQAPNVQAFVPSIAVGADGAVAITYYDFRNDNDDKAVLLTSLWRIVSTDRGVTWHEAMLAGPFDLASAPISTGQGYFVGDYQGLTAIDGGFLSFFVTANRGDAANPTDVYALTRAQAAHPPVTTRIEVNRYSLRLHEGPGPQEKK